MGWHPKEGWSMGECQENVHRQNGALTKARWINLLYWENIICEKA